MPEDLAEKVRKLEDGLIDIASAFRRFVWVYHCPECNDAFKQQRKDLFVKHMEVR